MGVYLLTGAGSGIGRVTAHELARNGIRCVLVDRNTAAIEALRDALPTVASGPHLALTVDLTQADQIQALAHLLPTLDAIINNAGMTDRSNLPIVAQDPANWQQLLALNLHAPARLVRALQGQLAKGARIVNVASGAGLHAIPWRGAYSPSKAGLIAQTQALANAHPEYCVSVLCPGFVRTELVDALIASGRLDPTKAMSKIPLGRMAEPEEMAYALAFLASPQAAPISGGVLSVDGGSSVFGGSQAYTPNDHVRVPADFPLALTMRGEWANLQSSPVGHGYPATIDATILASPVGQRLNAAFDAVRRFDLAQPGSLTLLLPSEESDDWEHAGDLASTRMLVSTLASEWGPSGRRINAVTITRRCTPETLTPLLHFVAGPKAQYLTGQTLCAR
ncbi:SDR family NAD(P)-dependent oxidoreductase [Bordetella genomosp. 4]|uniref:SDR family NAD(P)-dependent oxidoreductase n=1 Tax=Bordetella genomosp. 4 TaxID=463044 RepID=UPI000B9E60F1|nr:SDR family oxidoreductase [Bordetella genomosp. 4]OZI44238.1 short-chain dehydrogenase [Bordetella genomosp. 4]